MSIKEIAKKRFACKVFDKSKKIPKETIQEVLEIGSLAPSSFGMEGWKVLVITNDELKAKLKPLCWNQEQITTCSHLLVILSAIKSLKVESNIPQKRLQRRDLSKEMLEAYIQKYSSFLKSIAKDDKELFCWSARQSYILATYLMLGAKSLGVDSCPIEGFEQEKIEELLKIDKDEFRVSLLLPLGYCAMSQPKKVRLPLDEIIEYLD